jgi:hypothetical protein
MDWGYGSSHTASLYTYCIDVASAINIDNATPYTFTFTSLSNSSNVFTSGVYGTAVANKSATIAQAITNLWNFAATLTNSPVSGNVSNISAVNAQDFQIALWDIIYNFGATNVVASPTANLDFNASSGGYATIGSLAVPLGWANTAWMDAVNNTDPKGVSELGLTALVTTDDGQSQLYITATPMSLPQSFGTGLALLGMIAMGTAGRSRIKNFAAQFMSICGSVA